jgi:hypothetical protein
LNIRYVSLSLFSYNSLNRWQAYAVIWIDEEAQETELVGERDHPATSPRVEELCVPFLPLLEYRIDGLGKVLLSSGFGVVCACEE